MKIGIASDHAGYSTKEQIKELLNLYEIIDFGNNTYDPTDDYPTYAIKLGEALNNKEIDMGIVLCNSGIGVSIACNKVNGVRCAKVDSLDDAKTSRIDNDANIIALNANNPVEELKKYIELFINTSFSEIERHRRRVEKIINYEQGKKNV